MDGLNGNKADFIPGGPVAELSLAKGKQEQGPPQAWHECAAFQSVGVRAVN